MQVHVLMFAVLRDIVGAPERSLSLAEGETAGSLWQKLRAEYPRLEAYATPPLVAINEEYADPATLLQPGDRVAFIPPVSGG